MIKKEELYLGGTTSGETLKPFLFHVVMMFVLPVMAFFFSRDMLASRGYNDKDRNIYAGFISIVFVILVIVSYVLRIIADEDNWTPQKQAPLLQKSAAAIENKTSKQTKSKAKAPTQTPAVVPQEIKTTQDAKTTQNTKNTKQKSAAAAPQKIEEPKEVKESKSNNESNIVTQRNTTANQKKEKNAAHTPAPTKKNNSSNPKNSKNAPKPKAKKEEEVKQPVPPKRKIKSNNPFDHII